MKEGILMKRTGMILLVGFLLCALVFCAWAETPDVLTDKATGLLYRVEQDETNTSFAVLVGSATHTLDRLDIPETVEGIAVRKIGYHAFSSFSGLERVTFPEGVTEIGDGAFAYCRALKEISLPSTLKKMGAKAFAEIAAEGIDLPDGVQLPEYEPWFYPSSVRDASGQIDYSILPDGTAVITYYRLPANGEADIPAEIDGIPVSTIANGSIQKDNLKKITIADGIRVLMDSLFSFADNLTEVCLPDSVEYIGGSCFSNCKLLKNFKFPSGLKIIGDAAFSQTKLRNVELPDNLHRIENSAFSCSNIEWLHLPEKLEYIGADAFEFHQLHSLYIPASVTEIGDGAFHAGYESPLKDVIIASADVKLGIGVFGYYRSIDSIDLYGVGNTEEVDNLRICCYSGSTADIFYQFHVDKDYDMDAAMRAWESGSFGLRTSEDGRFEYMIASDGGAVLVRYPIQQGAIRIPDEVDGLAVTGVSRTANLTQEELKSVRSVALGKNVCVIDKGTFEKMENLSSVAFPESLKTIRDNAFNHCSSLGQLKLPAALETIGDYAFANTKIHSVTLPSSVRTVGKGAFKSCKIQTLQLSEGLETIGESAFEPCSISTLVIPASVKWIGFDAFGQSSPSKLRKVTFRSADTNLDSPVFGDFYSSEENEENEKTGTALKVECLPGSAADRSFLYNCEKIYLKWGPEHILTAPAETVVTSAILPSETVIYEIIVPEGVEEIADGAFDGLTTLAKITLPNSLRRIGSRAFAGTGLTQIKFTAEITEIGKSAFEECLNLKTVAMAKGEPEIGPCAFMNCPILTQVQLPEGTKSIGDWAFKDCRKIRTMTIPNSVTSLGSSAFSGCHDLQSLKLPEGLTEISDSLCQFCRSLKTVNIPKQVKRIKSYAFANCRLLSAITLPEGLEIIDNSAFAQFESGAIMGYQATKGRETYTRMTKIIIPSSVTQIGKYAFSSCDALNSVTFAKNSRLESVGEGAFAWCTHLRNINLPDSVHEIGDMAFHFCMALQKADFGNGLTHVGSNMFRYDTALTQLTLPDTLISISEGFLDKIESDLTVICHKGSAIDLWLQANTPEVKVKYRK